MSLPWDELEPAEPEPERLPDVIPPQQPPMDIGQILGNLTNVLNRLATGALIPPERNQEMSTTTEPKKGNGAIAKVIDTLIGWLPQETQVKIKNARKAIVTAIGSLLTVLTFVSGNFGFLIPPQYKGAIAAAIAFLTTLLTYTTPNTPNPNAEKKPEVVDPTGA